MRKRSALALTLAAAASVLGGTALPAAAQEAYLYPKVVENTKNWNGYVVQGAAYTSVAGLLQQVVTDNMAGASTWLGIGGWNSTDLIQAGIDVDANGLSFAWYELLPAPPRHVFQMNSNDDVLEVSIVESKDGGQWQVRLNEWPDVGTGKAYPQSSTPLHSFNGTVAYASCHCSAEWIVEPAGSDPRTGQVLPPPVAGGGAFWRIFAVADGQFSFAGALQPTFVRIKGSTVIPSTFPNDAPGSTLAVLFANS